MAKTKYDNVYLDNNGDYFYEISLGTDSISGKRVKKKSKFNKNNKKFKTAEEVNKEVLRLKYEYSNRNDYSYYNITFEEFTNNFFIPYYKTEVRNQTFLTKRPILSRLINRFGKTKLREISVKDINFFKTWLLSESGGGFFFKLCIGKYDSTKSNIFLCKTTSNFGK